MGSALRTLMEIKKINKTKKRGAIVIGQLCLNLNVEPQRTWARGFGPGPAQSSLGYHNMGYTVEPLLRHTPRWTAQGIPYEGLCPLRDTLKIDSKNQKKLEKYIIADSC
jgi:hypothetical protein